MSNKDLRAFHEPGIVSAIHLWIRWVDSQPSGSLYVYRRDRKEISKQVSNIIRYFDECHEEKVPRVIGVGN